MRRGAHLSAPVRARMNHGGTTAPWSDQLIVGRSQIIIINGRWIDDYASVIQGAHNGRYLNANVFWMFRARGSIENPLNKYIPNDLDINMNRLTWIDDLCLHRRFHSRVSARGKLAARIYYEPSHKCAINQLHNNLQTKNSHISSMVARFLGHSYWWCWSCSWCWRPPPTTPIVLPPRALPWRQPRKSPIWNYCTCEIGNGDAWPTTLNQPAWYQPSTDYW